MVFDFLKRKKPIASLLKVSLDGQELCSIGKVPIEELPVVQLKSDNPQLVFRDSDDVEYVHNLASVVDEGCTWIHLSVRLHEEYACQADCLIHNSQKIEESAFQKGLVKGIRFQPFYLPQCSADAKVLQGQGLFARGLHFSGTVTPGNVSLSCICDSCRESFRLQSFHAGFSNTAYFYCNSGPHTIIVGTHIKGAPSPLAKPDSEALAQLESELPKCQTCDGEFRYENPLLCPHCKRPYIDFTRHPELRESEYYGNYIYGSAPQEWPG
jgi:hypothetical protein